MIDVDLIQQCADPRLDVAIVQQFVAEMGAPDHPEKGGGKLEHGSGGMVRLRAAQKSSIFSLFCTARGGTRDIHRGIMSEACDGGMSQREASRHFGISRDTVRKMMAYSVPPGYRRQAPVRRPKLEAFIPIIEGWLETDRTVSRKQRHTARRVFDRLRDEHGFAGGYTIIKDYMRDRDRRGQGWRRLNRF